MQTQKQTNLGKVFLAVALLTLSIFSISFVSATGEFWACFTDGDTIDYCSSNIPDRFCSSDICKYCMKTYDENNDCYSPGSFSICTGTATNSCTGGTTGSGNDQNAPIINLNSPLNGSVYTDRSVMFSLNTNEISDVYYLDLINGRGRWTRVCTDCSSYSKRRSFKEGFNSLQIRATDVAGNEAFRNVDFFIDSKNPQITKTEPKKGFANGDFMVQFKELNPRNLTLNYGNFIQGFRTAQINLSICVDVRGKVTCETSVNLASFDGQTIEYWFSLKDVANNVKDSKHIFLQVDTTFPEFDNVVVTVDDSKGIFNIQTSEPVTLEYIDFGESRPSWRRLCSDCASYTRSKTFRDGMHLLNLQATDEAGNSVGTALNFTI